MEEIKYKIKYIIRVTGDETDALIVDAKPQDMCDNGRVIEFTIAELSQGTLRPLVDLINKEFIQPAGTEDLLLEDFSIEELIQKRSLAMDLDILDWLELTINLKEV